jgi:hypothetical protein
VGLTPTMIAAASVSGVSATACFALMAVGLVPLLLPALGGRPRPAPAASRIEHAGL